MENLRVFFPRQYFSCSFFASVWMRDGATGCFRRKHGATMQIHIRWSALFCWTHVLICVCSSSLFFLGKHVLRRCNRVFGEKLTTVHYSGTGVVLTPFTTYLHIRTHLRQKQKWDRRTIAEEVKKWKIKLMVMVEKESETNLFTWRGCIQKLQQQRSFQKDANALRSRA